jgi:type I restriction enzyme S subunit
MTEATRNLLEQHFDTAFAAPDGVAKLRELILTLAMQGKLAEQDPNDPPASELLKKIEAEKKRMVKTGKIKQPKPLPPIKPEEMPYKLPQGWEWVRLGDFLQMINGRAFKPSDWIAEGLPIVRIQNLNNHQASFNYCDKSDVKDQHLIDNGEFLISWSGTPGTSFGAFIWRGGEAALNQHIFKCFQIGSPCTDEFLRLAINSRLDFLISQAQGAVGLKHVTKGTLENMLLPLPPLPEQYRIVARIDQLMARCDALEKLRKERQEKRLAVHAAAIKQLLDTPDGSAWDFIQQHFGTLYTVEENVAELRKAILQLAVMGRLVPQNPNDPSASELLKEIEAEKQRLVKAGKIKKPKPLPPIKPEEVPYELPLGWEWVRLGGILCFGPTNGFSPRAVDYETPVRSLTLSATTSGVFKGEYSKFITDEIPEDSTLWLEDGDILVQRGNTLDYVGVPAVYRGKSKQFIYPDLMMKIRVFDKICTDFTHRALSAKTSRNYLRNNASGTSSTMPKINQSTLCNLLFPIPPLTEQQRIVTRIDQLMALCDTLDQKIDATTGKQTALLNAVMGQV